MTAKKRVFNLGDRVRIKEVPGITNVPAFADSPRALGLVGSYRVVTGVGDTGIITITGTDYVFGAEDLKFVRSKAQAREAQRGWRGKKRNPIQAPAVSA